MRHIISLLLENEPGALSRVVGLFSQRNYNIESLTVAATEDPSLSRLTLTTIGQDDVIEQITKNLNKLIEVVKLVNLSESAHIERELMLVKVKATGAQRAEIKRTTDIFRGQIVEWHIRTHTHFTAHIGHQRPHQAVPRGHGTLVDGQGIIRHQRSGVHRAHRADADIILTANILMHIVYQLKIQSIEELYEASEDARIPRSINFGKHRGTAIAELPKDYVQWLLRQDELDPYLRKALENANIVTL